MPDESPAQAPGSADAPLAPASLDVIFGFGSHQIIEQRIRSAIEARGWRLLARSATQDQLLEIAARGMADVAFYSRTLAGYQPDLPQRLLELGVRPVEVTSQSAPLLVADTDLGELVLVMSLGSIDEGMAELGATEISAAEMSAVAAEAEQIREPASATTTPAPILMVTSSKGSPGKTTVALGLAAALGRLLSPERVVVADFDLRLGNIAPWLRLDATRGLIGTLNPGSMAPERAAAEVVATPWFLALPGLEHGGDLDPALLGRTLSALARDAHSGVVVADAMPLAQPGVVFQQAAAVLMVVEPDQIGAWNARSAIANITAAGKPMVVAVNQWDPRRSAATNLDELTEAIGIESAIAGVPVRVVGIPVHRDLGSLQISHIAPGAEGGGVARAFSMLAEYVLLTLAAADPRQTWAFEATAPQPRRFERFRRRREPAGEGASDLDSRLDSLEAERGAEPVATSVVRGNRFRNLLRRGRGAERDAQPDAPPATSPEPSRREWAPADESAPAPRATVTDPTPGPHQGERTQEAPEPDKGDQDALQPDENTQDALQPDEDATPDASAPGGPEVTPSPADRTTGGEEALDVAEPEATDNGAAVPSPRRGLLRRMFRRRPSADEAPPAESPTVAVPAATSADEPAAAPARQEWGPDDTNPPSAATEGGGAESRPSDDAS